MKYFTLFAEDHYCPKLGVEHICMSTGQYNIHDSTMCHHNHQKAKDLTKKYEEQVRIIPHQTLIQMSCRPSSTRQRRNGAFPVILEKFFIWSLEISIDLHEALVQFVLPCISWVWFNPPTISKGRCLWQGCFVGLSCSLWIKFGNLIFRDQHWSASRIDPMCHFMHQLGPDQPFYK